MYQGIMNVYKEAGFTSHDVVARLRGICGQKKIGHTGTLDPAAVGVLPVALGNATKLCDMLSDREKEYVALLRLGLRTDTQDATGRILEQKEVTVSEKEVREAILGFQGGYLQVPPMYSALKINGKRLYELARAGREVERIPRPVTVYEIEILRMELPDVEIRVVCSKGTYIRTLCEDIGQKLGCGGIMVSLTRTRAGDFRLEDALTLDEIQDRREKGILEKSLRPVEDCFPGTAALHVTEEYVKLAENGNSLYPSQTREKLSREPGEWVRMYDTAGRFYGIYAFEKQRGQYRPVKMFL